jgi:hypothetical protein
LRQRAANSLSRITFLETFSGQAFASTTLAASRILVEANASSVFVGRNHCPQRGIFF